MSRVWMLSGLIWLACLSGWAGENEDFQVKDSSPLYDTLLEDHIELDLDCDEIRWYLYELETQYQNDQTKEAIDNVRYFLERECSAN